MYRDRSLFLPFSTADSALQTEDKMADPSELTPREIVVFDFDGTITTRDTFALFLRYYAGLAGWSWRIAMLLPTFLLYGLRIIDRNAVKRAVIRRFFKNANKDTLDATARRFAAEVIPELIRPQAQTKLDAHKTDPESLYICSASITPYLEAWAESQGIKHVLATELAEHNGTYTGEIQGWNIWGPGKIQRIEAEFGEFPFRIREAYGDSRGDRELLHAADVSHFKPFRLNELRD